SSSYSLFMSVLIYWGDYHMYETGKGVELNDKKAAEWYLKAANQDIAEAQNSLGLMYFEGRGVEQDKIKSQEWYRKSCDNGYQPSCDELSLIK
ncbi:MAG: tetratricopeptide repeat protein, partial [Psychrobacter sp.]